MLKSHMDAVEASLLSLSRIAADAGHTLHRGTPRETFVKGFLDSHLGQRVGIGTGEIIDANSKPREKRNQIDVVVYKLDYPRLTFGGGVTCFLVESVIAIIEVKSILDKNALKPSIQAAYAVKQLDSNIKPAFHVGFKPPGILSLLVGYDGPASMSTTLDWIRSTHRDLGIIYPDMPPDIGERRSVSSPSIDAVFVLGKGFACFDNMPLGIITDEDRQQNPDMKWYYRDGFDGNLLVLFTLLTLATSGVSAALLEPSPYLAACRVPRDSIGFES